MSTAHWDRQSSRNEFIGSLGVCQLSYSRTYAHFNSLVGVLLIELPMAFVAPGYTIFNGIHFMLSPIAFRGQMMDCKEVLGF